MIVRHQREAASNKGFRHLARYIQGRGAEPRTTWFRAANLPGVSGRDDLELACALVEAVQAQNTRAGSKRTYHLVISLHPDDRRLERKELQQVVDKLVDTLGFSEHQYIAVRHNDTDHEHIHVAINKIHPETFRIHSPAWDHQKLFTGARALERELGLIPLRSKTRDREKIPERAIDCEANEGIKSFARWARENLRPALRRSELRRWDDVHEACGRLGVVIRPQGNGLVFEDVVRGVRVEASAVGWLSTGVDLPHPPKGSLYLLPMKSPAEADYLARALEVAIHLAVIAVIVLGAFWMFSPFVMVVLWAIVLAVTFYPLYGAIRNVVGGRRKLAGTFFIVLSLAVVLVPVWLLTSSLVDAAVVARQQAEAGTLVIPAPTDEVKDWPVIGERVYEIWQNASVDLQNTAQKFQPQIRSVARKIMSGLGDLAGALGQTVLAIIIAGVLMINAEASARAARSIVSKLGGDRGPPMLDLSVATIRSVVKGVVFVALIQALLAAAGLAMARVPFVGLWALLVMMLAVVQLPPILILGPIIPWVFAHNESIWVSVFFTVWSVVVSASDPLFKMLLLGRGLAVPMLIILAGAIGGMIRAGMIGFFVGPVLLAIFYQLFTAWLRQDGPDVDPAMASSSS